MLPCEIAVKSVIPAVKALIAKELVEKHRLKQNEVAEILGISQSAVSKYTRRVRGHVIKIDDVEEIKPLINEVVDLLSGRKFQRKEFLRFFCQTCMMIRRKSLMCQFCQRANSRIKMEECDFCLTMNLPCK